MDRITAVTATREQDARGRCVVVELRQHPARERAGEAEHAGVEDRADERVPPSERDERRSGRVDERRRRPSEEHEGGDGEDEAEGDAIRIGALDRDRKAFRQRRGEEKRPDAGDRRGRTGVAGEGDGRYRVRSDANERDRRDDRE